MRRFFVVILVLGILSWSLEAQTSKLNVPVGRITIRLRNVCGVAVKDAVVVIQQGKSKHKLKSGDDGIAETFLPKGKYHIVVNKYAFKKYIVKDVVISDSEDAHLDLKMEAGYASDDPKPWEDCPE